MKDVLAHTTAWDLFTIEKIRNLREGKDPYWEPSVNKFNKKETLKRKNWSWDEVYGEFIEAGESLIREYQRTPEELWNKKFLEIDIEHYRDEHLPEIKKLLK